MRLPCCFGDFGYTILHSLQETLRAWQRRCSASQPTSPTSTPLQETWSTSAVNMETCQKIEIRPGSNLEVLQLRNWKLQLGGKITVDWMTCNTCWALHTQVWLCVTQTSYHHHLQKYHLKQITDKPLFRTKLSANVYWFASLYVLNVLNGFSGNTLHWL